MDKCDNLGDISMHCEHLSGCDDNAKNSISHKRKTPISKITKRANRDKEIFRHKIKIPLLTPPNLPFFRPFKRDDSAVCRQRAPGGKTEKTIEIGHGGNGSRERGGEGGRAEVHCTCALHTFAGNSERPSFVPCTAALSQKSFRPQGLSDTYTKLVGLPRVYGTHFVSSLVDSAPTRPDRERDLLNCARRSAANREAAVMQKKLFDFLRAFS
ncbi:hypothetical protein EVAR_14171_1 [Eumeta japonica]|uniref:Uncharacterized protein n=1 Tax=Eumeta variegata TaxID=151549 RepID=A0A4C1UEN3_EUMVA|nr:hypothetical protein EVAR_14171_1 [Eumeta japonica]